MAPHASDFRFLVATARRGIADLRRALHRVQLDEKERGARFVGAAEALLEAIEAGVGGREEEFATAGDEIDRESLVRAMRQIANDIRNVHSTTPWIDAAHSSRLPLGLVYFVDEMASALIKQPTDVITVPSPNYMYSTQHKPFLPELRALQCDYPEGMPIIVLYPVQEVDSVFLHLLIAHELGHSVIPEHDLLPRIAARAAGSVDISQKLGEVVTQAVAIEHWEAEEATATISALFVRWLTEATCDALALGLLGPSFLLSVTTFLTPFAGPRPSPTHPPNNLRMEMLLNYIETWAWRPLLEVRATAALEWFDEIAAETMDAQHRTYYEAHGDLIRALAPAIESVVAEHLGDKLFTPTIYQQEAEAIAGFLNLEVLPAQHLGGAPVDRRAVLLAGWLHMFEAKGGTPDKLPEVVGERDFQGFLAKALEMSAVLERWPETTA